MKGVLLALFAMCGWGLADFLVQRAARKVGNVTTLFAGSLLGFVLLFPSAYGDLGLLAGRPRLALLIGLSALVTIFTALFSLEAYRRGKLTAVEPVMGLELPFTIMLAVAIGGERLSVPQVLAMIAIFLGIVLTSAANGAHPPPGKRLLERGVVFGLIGALGLGAFNFLTGIISQEATPVLAVWTSRTAVAVIIGAFIVVRGRLGESLMAMRRHPALVFGVSALYLAAFLAYGVAVTLIPISIATGISVGYIMLTVLLGVFINKERLSRHQVGGVIVVTSAITLLSYLSSLPT